MKALVIPISIAILLGFAAGWLTAPRGERVSSAAGGESLRVADPSRAPVVVSFSEHETPTRRRFSAPLETPADCKAMLTGLDTLAGHEHPLVISALRDRALRRWLDLDAEGALAFAEAGVKGPWEPGVATDLFRVWLDLDVASALDAFAQASPALVAAAQHSFFSDLAQLGPQSAIDELNHVRWQGLRRDLVAGAIFSVWAAEDPRAAAEAANRWVEAEGPADPDYHFQHPNRKIAAIWAQGDPLAAWEFYRENNWFKGMNVQLASYLLEHDPDADIGEVPDHASNRIARSWAKRDIGSALAFAEANGDRPIAKQLLQHVARELASSEPERALDLLERAASAEVNYEVRGVLRSAFAALSHRDHEGSLRRVAELSPELQSAALSGVLTHSHAADPAGTPALLRKLLDDPATSGSVLPAMEVAFSWSHGGGAQDLGEIVAALPEFAERIGERLLGGWIQTDPEEAAAFIAGRLAADTSAFYKEEQEIAELGYSRPEFTGGWLQTLPAGSFRTSAAASLAANWSRFDPIGAAAWVEGLAPGAMRDSAANALGK